jgi:hypothetical protein
MAERAIFPPHDLACIAAAKLRAGVLIVGQRRGNEQAYERHENTWMCDAHPRRGIVRATTSLLYYVSHSNSFSQHHLKAWTQTNSQPVVAVVEIDHQTASLFYVP